MKIIGLCVCGSAVLGGMYLHGDLDGGELYNLPADQVYAGMARADIPRSLTGGLLTTQEISKETGSGKFVKWVFRQKGKNIGALVATHKPSGEARTRVKIKFEPGSADDSIEQVADAQAYARGVGKTVMTESLDAAIERRPVNQQIVQDAMMGYIMANQGAVGRETQAMFNEVSKSMREASSRESVSPSGATAPMTDLSKYDRGNTRNY